MTEQEKHIEMLKELATLDPGTWQMGKGMFQVKTTANDIINAGKRLEELGIFKFDKQTDNTLIIKIVD